MSLFGSGGVVIAGRHVSYGLLAVLLSVPVAGLAIYQFRTGAIGAGVSSGSGSPSVDSNGNILDSNGNVIGTAVGALSGAGGGGGASDAALQNLGQQVSGLADYLRGLTPLSTPAVAYSPSGSQYTAVTRSADIQGASAGVYIPPAPANPYAGTAAAATTVGGSAQRTFYVAPYVGTAAAATTVGGSAQRTFYVAPSPITKTIATPLYTGGSAFGKNPG